MGIQLLWLWAGVVLGVLGCRFGLRDRGVDVLADVPADVLDYVPADVLAGDAAIAEFSEFAAFSEARYHQAVELAQFKGDFLARTAHELRSPLSTLMGLHQLILADLCDSPEEERQCVAQAYEAAQNFYGLLETVIEVSQLELGRKSLDIQPLAIDLLTEDVVTSVQLPLADRNVRFQVVPWATVSNDATDDVTDDATDDATADDASTLPAVKADYGCLRQVLIQLILMAAELKATDLTWSVVPSADGEQIGFVLSDNRAPEAWQETLADWPQPQTFMPVAASANQAEAHADLKALKNQWTPARLSPGLSLWVQRQLIESMGGRLTLGAAAIASASSPAPSSDSSSAPFSDDPSSDSDSPNAFLFLESPAPQEQLCCWFNRA